MKKEMKMVENPVLRVCTKVLFGPIILYGLYVQFHGEYGPGGGFQAGVIVAAAFILYGLVFGIAAVKRIAPDPVVRAFGKIGVIIYAGVGVVNMLRGGNFLDYNTLGAKQAKAQHIGILVIEAGVGITVTAVMLGLFYVFVGYRGGRR